MKAFMVDGIEPKTEVQFASRVYHISFGIVVVDELFKFIVFMLDDWTSQGRSGDSKLIVFAVMVITIAMKAGFLAWLAKQFKKKHRDVIVFFQILVLPIIMAVVLFQMSEVEWQYVFESAFLSFGVLLIVVQFFWWPVVVISNISIVRRINAGVLRVIDQ